MNGTTTTRTVGFVGRCKGCKSGHRAEVKETVRRWEESRRTVGGLEGFPVTRRRYSYPENGRGYESPDAWTHVTVACGCGRQVSLKRVQGVVNDHVCNAKCMNSTGPSCECSCGGANHGRGHNGGTLTIVIA